MSIEVSVKIHPSLRVSRQIIVSSVERHLIITEGERDIFFSSVATSKKAMLVRRTPYPCVPVSNPNETHRLFLETWK